MTSPVTARAPDAETPAVADTGADDGTVLLATFDVPFDDAAARFAVDAAVDSGRRLIVANIVELPPLPMSVMLGYDMLDYTPEMAASLLGPVQRAQTLGVHVERIRVKSFRRIDALVDVARERKVRMLVLGPDREKVNGRLYKRAAAAARERLECLVWISWEISPK
jgi:nucleotide-binding universal stress UspA family protein